MAGVWLLPTAPLVNIDEIDVMDDCDTQVARVAPPFAALNKVGQSSPATVDEDRRPKRSPAAVWVFDDGTPTADGLRLFGLDSRD